MPGVQGHGREGRGGGMKASLHKVVDLGGELSALIVGDEFGDRVTVEIRDFHMSLTFDIQDSRFLDDLMAALTVAVSWLDETP
jgi:hypothetical protein